MGTEIKKGDHVRISFDIIAEIDWDQLKPPLTFNGAYPVKIVKLRPEAPDGWEWTNNGLHAIAAPHYVRRDFDGDMEIGGFAPTHVVELVIAWK